jgi:hypothetical protein
LLSRSQQRYFNILDFMACQDLRIKLNLKKKKSTHTEPKKQKMGDFAAMMIEMKKTNGMLNDQNTKSNEIKKMIEKQSNESKEQCDEIKESINNIKDEVVRVEVETKRAFVDLEARMEENIKEQITGMKQETVQQEARKKEVIMFRIEESNEHEDNNDYVKSEVLKALKCFSTVEELDVAFCRRIGPKRPKRPNIPRPVIVRLKTVAKRDDILDLANQNGIAGVEENLTKIQQAAKKIMLDDMKTKNEEAGQRAFKMVGRSGIYKLVKQNPRRESEMTT